MKKNRIIKAFVYLFAVALLSSAMVVQTKAMATGKDVKTNVVVKQQDPIEEAQAAVHALYIDDVHSDIKDDVTRDDIDKASALVDKLDEGWSKRQLEFLITKAYYRLHERNARILVYALYKDSEHTIIRDDLTQAEIDYARDFVEQLGFGLLKYELRILVNNAQDQFDERNPQFVLPAVV